MMVHPGLATWKVWDCGEYATGYLSRVNGISNSELAHHCWQCGWEDADTEMLEAARHNRAVEEGREDDFASTWGLLFDAGGDARVNGIPFDGSRTGPWKEGWIAADIQLGTRPMSALSEQST